MNAQVTQILKAYEELHLGVEDIALEQGLSVEEIRICLAQFSATYRKALETKEGVTHDAQFTNDDNELSKNVIRGLMLTTDDENLKFRAAKYIRQDKMGRLDGVKALRNLNINVMLFNEQVRKMQASRERTLNGINNQSAQQEKEVIEV